jgi:hypothetical protein
LHASQDNKVRAFRNHTLAAIVLVTIFPGLEKDADFDVTESKRLEIVHKKRAELDSSLPARDVIRC